jgi:hypothetical protein
LTTFVRAVFVVLVLASLVACQASSSGSPSAAASQSPAASGSADPSTEPSTAPSIEPSAAPSVSGSVDLADLDGVWTFEAGEPRVIAATGDYAGGTARIDNGRSLVFTAGDFRHEEPITVGTRHLSCDSDSCEPEGMPMASIRAKDGQTLLVSNIDLEPVTDWNDSCDWAEIPDGSVVAFEWDGVTPPSVFRFVHGIAGGVGDGCSTGSFVIAWDVTATRNP